MYRVIPLDHKYRGPEAADQMVLIHAFLDPASTTVESIRIRLGTLLDSTYVSLDFWSPTQFIVHTSGGIRYIFSKVSFKPINIHDTDESN